MLTFSETVNEAAVLAQRSGDADYLTKLGVWVNFAHDKLGKAYDFWTALQNTYRFSSVDGTEKYYLPSDFDKPYRIIDRTNSRKLSIFTREEYYSANISTVVNTSKGVPQYAMLYGVNAVSYEPTSSFTVKINSSDTTDNGGIIARVEGWLDSAKTILGHESITVSTSSPTTYVAGTVTFYGITRFTKSDDTNGYLTLADSSSNVLATIPPDDRQSRFPVLYLGLIPNSVNSYDVLYKRSIKRMVNDFDYPFMDCTNYLVMEALGYAFHQEKESEGRANAMWQKAQEELLTLLRNEQDKLGPDFQHKVVPLTAQAHRY